MEGDDFMQEKRFTTNNKRPLNRADQDAIWLGDLIRNERNKQSITQQELCERASINNSYLSAIEHGYSFISVSKLLSICEGLDISPGYILDQLAERRALQARQEALLRAEKEELIRRHQESLS